MDFKEWNNNLKHLRQIILKKGEIAESKDLFLSLHAMVHSSNMSGIDEKTFEDELWENLEEDKFRIATNEKSRTIAYGMWHFTRIEDITMNILVDKGEQVLNTGNALTKEQN